MAEGKKDVWDKASVVASISASMVTPLLVALLGYYIHISDKYKEPTSAVINQCLSILREYPDTTKVDQMALRGWAIEVVDNGTGTLMSDSVKNALMYRLPLQQSNSRLVETFNGDLLDSIAGHTVTVDEIKEKISYPDGVEVRIVRKSNTLPKK